MRRAGSVLVLIGLVLGGTLAAAEPPKQPLGLGQLIVTDGPYAISRNPMYAGSFLTLLGIGLVRGSVPALISPVVFAAILTRGQIAFEERALNEAYGSLYAEYRQRVRRWI